MKLPTVLRHALSSCALIACAWLQPHAHAELSLQANGSTSIVTMNGGEALTFSWSASADTTYLRRSWGTSPDTQLPAFSGSETIHAPNPNVTTGYLYTISGYDAANSPVQASVQVNVVPNPTAPSATPIVWTPSLGFQNITPLSFYILPDALIGSLYSASIEATGNGPLTFSAVNLPDGLSVVGNTITGVPTSAALLDGGNFTLIATDADGFSSATLARMRTPVLEPRNLPAVTAPVVFDGGAADLNGSYDNDAGFNQERAMTGFMLSADKTVTGVKVWGTYMRRFKAGTDNFTIKFYERGPSPLGWVWESFPAPGNLIATFTPISVTRSTTGRAAFGVPDSEYAYDLGFSGITLKANTLYYVSVYNNTQEQWAWMVSTIQNYPSWGAWSQDGGLTFPGGSAELALQLKEGAIVQPPPPPPPSTNTFKLDIKRNGKGTVTLSPNGSGYSGTVFAAGTVVALTAAPDPTDARSVWKGWTGDVVSSRQTITVIMTKNVSVQANFR